VLLEMNVSGEASKSGAPPEAAEDLAAAVLAVALSAAGWLPLVFTHASSDREIVASPIEALQPRS